ncbi:HDOD domain-containing protein [Pseudomaricurvus alkylphenolicus]|uniref:HDOD domain-containing protein n=1 Tax=Pseudomaricurvus alkylphenolicus TaxID=1306991 RepID=UPI001F0E9145|nr:HDOD domain-containing protein [Pseudomaricurvus alkylphenolicus]
MAVAKLFRKLFGKSPDTPQSTGAKPLALERTFEIAEPYTMGIRSIEDGFYRALFASSSLSDPLTTTQKQAQEAVRQKLGAAESRDLIVPRLPSVIPRLMRSLRDPDSSASDYVAIINKDPAMSAAVLKLANTVYFNPANRRITSIETAVVKLGIEGLRSVLSAAVMQPVIQKDSPYFNQFGEQLWQHSLQCAVTCETIAATRGAEPYKAYLLGLTHDIGKITAFSELCREFKLKIGRDTPGYQAFVPVLQKISAPLSYQIARNWDLPDEICNALKQQVNLQPGRKVDTYAHILFQANLICEVMGAPDFHPPKAVDRLIRAMQLPANLNTSLQELSMEL